MNLKEELGKRIAQKVKNGEIIGVGTGSTVDAAISAIAERVKLEKLDVSVVPTSYQSAWACESIGLRVLSPMYTQKLSWGFDGADAVDKDGNLVKGKGGALLEEKILAKKCFSYIIVADESKLTSDICKLCAIPIEVIPSSLGSVKEDLLKLKVTTISLRESGAGKHGPVITERGNIIIDASFSAMRVGLERDIKNIVGVVESGLFEKYATEVWIATKDGINTITF